MMTTNKLTKTFASGSLAIGVLAGAVLTATSASAMTKTWQDWVGGNPLTAGDKIVTFVSQDNFGAEDLDEVTLMFMGDEYDFIYNAITLAAPDPNTNSGSFTYTIEIDPNPIYSDQYITGVALDSDATAGNYGTVTKTFDEIPLVLTSTDGSADPLSGFYPIAPIKKLTVTDTLASNPGQALFTLSNAYTQKVPEPGTILGLLAVGGLGLVSRLKKQK
jgi:hypothetical protein